MVRPISALRALLPVQLADHPADRVHFQLHLAGPAAQVLVVELLHAGAADADAGQRQHRVLGHVGLAGRRHVADDMGERLGRTGIARVVPTSTRMPGRSGAFTSICAMSSQLRNSRTHDGNEAAVAAQVALDARRARGRSAARCG